MCPSKACHALDVHLSMMTTICDSTKEKPYAVALELSLILQYHIRLPLIFSTLVGRTPKVCMLYRESLMDGSYEYLHHILQKLRPCSRNGRGERMLTFFTLAIVSLKKLQGSNESYISTLLFAATCLI